MHMLTLHIPLSKIWAQPPLHHHFVSIHSKLLPPYAHAKDSTRYQCTSLEFWCLNQQWWEEGKDQSSMVGYNGHSTGWRFIRPWRLGDLYASTPFQVLIYVINLNVLRWPFEGPQLVTPNWWTFCFATPIPVMRLSGMISLYTVFVVGEGG